MSGVIYVDNKTKIPLGVTGKDQKLKQYADMIGPILTIAGSQLDERTGAKLIGFDISGKGGKEIMFHKGKTVSLVYVGEKGIEINPAYLRDTVKSFEQELESNPEMKRKIETGEIDKSVSVWMEKKGFLDIKPVMKRRGESKCLGDLIKINLERSTITSENRNDLRAYEKLRPKDERIKGIYATLKNGASETYKMVHGEEPEKVDVILEYKSKIIRAEIN